MAVAPIIPILLAVVIGKSRGDATISYNHNNGNGGTSQFGELLKPPPPPPLSQLLPVPFHGGSGRLQKQNEDVGYHYQPPPLPPLLQIPPSTDFKFPAPFYKQYNFNFVPPPQPFSTTPSPSMFQKVSSWLFPSQQTYDSGSTVFNNNNLGQLKKDCNPCNLVPWIPVIRYNVGAKNIQQNIKPNINPTYGPPSPTAIANVQNVHQYQTEGFQHQNQNPRLPQISAPHAIYGLPLQTHFSGSPSSTYGPPSPTHSIINPTPRPLTSTFSAFSTFTIPSSSYGVPNTPFVQPSKSIEQPGLAYGVPSSTYGLPSTTYRTPTSIYTTPSPTYGTPSVPPFTSTYQPVTPHTYDVEVLNGGSPPQNDVEILRNIENKEELQLPKVSRPTAFRNSYGEPITNTYALDIPYSVSATAAESSKVKTEVLPNEGIRTTTPNISLALANPAPFTLNRGRNIHTLQPVALPNLSVSPLPPIFNARPFRTPTAPKFPTNVLQGINHMQQVSNNVNIEQSVPLAEYTHSVDYPISVVQSPVIDIDSSRIANQSKTYRNIPNGFIIDEFRDISSQASEDHVSATKSVPDSSFESTGGDVGNDIYDNVVPSELKYNTNVPNNHKPVFADLRGVKDEDVDKYRTESNLQHIDSPLLYLKPSAPHKGFGRFLLASSSPSSVKEYEMYDDIPTTSAPQLSTLPSAWDESRNYYTKDMPQPSESQKDGNKPKIVQIIVPYTIGQQNAQSNFDYEQNVSDWESNAEEEYQGRKVPPNTENYSTVSTTTEEPMPTENTESYESDRQSTGNSLSDLYDVKEPPFDIIKLQHTIDDWTEQEYAKEYKTPERTRNSEQYAKKIPDEYFTTTVPTNYVTATNNYNYDFYDHEGSSSIQHTVTKDKNTSFIRPRKEYNTIDRSKNKQTIDKTEIVDDVQKLHIYTAASTFRSTTTTPAPWGAIQTSISPLTKEKVYVVTSKPWRDTRNSTKDWYNIETFESKKTGSVSSSADDLPFKSPRFSNRPSFGFSSNGNTEAVDSESSYSFSRNWYQSINDLESRAQISGRSLPEGPQQKANTNTDEGTMIAEAPEEKDV